jgi:hypothetical protein
MLMTAAFASGRRTESRSEQLESLRRQMASVAGRTAVPGAAVARADDLLPGPGSRLPLPQWLADALPAPLPRGSVAVLTGARSLVLGMVAAVTAAGGNAAIVGQQREFLQATKAYNLDIAEYAMAVADASVPDDRFVSILIGTPIQWRQPQQQQPVQPAAPPASPTAPTASGTLGP